MIGMICPLFYMLASLLICWLLRIGLVCEMQEGMVLMMSLQMVMMLAVGSNNKNKLTIFN